MRAHRRRWLGRGWVPDGALGNTHTRLLLALIRLHDRDGRATVGGVAQEAGYSSVGAIHHYLVELRDFGLVTWEDGRAATLRPLVTIPMQHRHATVT